MERTKEMNTWKPIASAPKDGTPILVGVWGREDWHTVVAYWIEDSEATAGGAWELVEAGTYGDDGLLDWKPTHWTEIPTPPTK